MSWKSYIIPLCLYKGKTKLNTPIEVIEVCGHKRLEIMGIQQSSLFFRRFWKNIINISLSSNIISLRKVLILGLGGGDLISILNKIEPLCKLTIVELEPEVVQVADRHFGIRNTNNISIIVKDAKNYLDINTQKFNFIIVDLYHGDVIPDFVATYDFLQNIKKGLVRGGSALFNYASNSFSDDDFINFENVLNRIFSKVEKHDYSGHTFYLTY